jgi:hypothetical protein
MNWQLTFEFTDSVNLIKVPITVYATSYDEGFEKALGLGVPQANEDNLYLSEAIEMDEELILDYEPEETEN